VTSCGETNFGGVDRSDSELRAVKKDADALNVVDPIEETLECV
jgi:hypothetical protein